MGLILLEICDLNLLSESALAELLEQYPEVAVMSYECQNLCGLCRMRPYALVNGQRIFGKDIKECIENIRVKIEEELSLFA
ncbi:DUF1450 domain-containing protein [Cytobacillus horneckiae]|uniref:DUF1450 domain-containing protein n=1 Tax=Cytobacillus horneckiae TaxID=549687 RepID=A0A2N0ZAA0_9BACI|nr:DUF1450 domain-containing protein [Cytobacillus horneckiae]MEC1158035.1 DUF1450 domain-containing protein [Cytobacillus horneckiae]MED2937040.1 DUF1450 domain-containing protein [Cytobacillus horneckiae]PKG26433.1 DUF1450 domain-containing protein [Cytobacillus horneckiae]